ncbi:MAG: type IV pilus twitching motility protein PilT [Lachnospiraceae bacterium]|nr:type IV pilus twitching motility protein PilT [Lachnospiraceae bacterium]MBQ8167480.1 type IV pilus twitching motility protein PilT [Lachnospiraceae bacterium]
MTFVDLIEEAKMDGCSDVHITVGTSIARRRYGKLEMLDPIPTAQESTNLIIECLNQDQIEKVRAGQDLDFALMLPTGTRIRANIYHQRNNVAATYRILQTKIPTFDELDIPEAVRKLVNEPRGLVLITGPTGSGKTTTLASMIDYINKKMPKHVMTIEDPIEYVYPHAKSMIHQRQVGTDVESFASALRSALREDPDIILVGEMRDFETISAAITAAETGHLVFATLHTTTAAQTIERIIDAYPPHGQAQARTQLSNVLRGVVTQQLIPRDDEEGMVMATEILINNEAVANQIRENKTHQIPSAIQSGIAQGMHTMNADLKRLVKEHKITNSTALKFCTNVKDYENQR